jgi:hypothetical protein
MEQIFVELYRHNDKWESASSEFRHEFVDQLIGLMRSGGLEKLGIEVITYSFNSPATSHRADYDFVCVYKVQSEEQLREFEKMIEGSGWYEYFDQINAGGPAGDPVPALIAARDLRRTTE